MNEKTIHAKLIAKQEDSMGYINYVFRDVDRYDDYVYLSCTRLPNWNCHELQIRDKGYVTVREVKACEDTWYDGENNNPYKYDATYFYSFIPESKREYNYNL